ncbi:MAG: gliding motility-associated C-terminal domain-containing protein [Bacteroidales bacterium]
MKINKTVCFLFLTSFLLINSKTALTQTSPSDINPPFAGWTTDNPFKTDVFVENYGQFDEWVKSSLPIKYAINNHDKFFFSNQGVIIKLEKIEKLSEEEKEKQEKEGNKESKVKRQINYVAMNWVGCNSDAEIIASEISEAYYTFGEKGYENVKAKGFKKILYKNIYPNIDVEYSIPEKGGIKYKLILHPGADVKLIKMNYSGDLKKMKRKHNGNIIIRTAAGDICDHAPESYYEETNSKITSEFLLKGNTVSFQFPGLDLSVKSKTIIIDPWTTTPVSLLSNNVALDIDFDYFGNVYVSGGSGPFKLAKYSVTGNLIWTFTNPSTWMSDFYSKFCILPYSGTTLIGEAFSGSNPGNHILKISNAGILNFTSPEFGVNNEIWRMFYNNCSKQIIAFGGGTMYPDNIKIIADTNLSGSISKNFNGFNDAFNDVASAVMDNNGDFYALMTNYSGTQVEGRLQKSLFTSNYSPPLAFDMQTNCKFKEGYNFVFSLTGNMTVRANALALNTNYVFGYNGKTLYAWNKSNGILLNSIIVDNNYTDGNLRHHEGIDVDECNNVYVGGTNKVHVFSFNGNSFTPLNQITLQGRVFDIKLNRSNGKLYICGNTFITELVAPLSCSIAPIMTSVSTDSCSGKACVTATGGIPPYHYYWSNGITDSCLSGVAAGIYTVVVTDNSCGFNNIQIDTFIYNPVIQLSVTPYNPIICEGDTVTLHASSLNTGVNFHWNNGSNANLITVSPSQTSQYTVTATKNSCTNTAEITVTVINTNFSQYPNLCPGSAFTVGTHNYTANGVYNDTLSSLSGCDSIVTTHLSIIPIAHTIADINICEGQIYVIGSHIYNIAGVYTDTLLSSIGCDSIVTTHLTTLTPYLNLGSDTSICNGTPLLLKVTFPNATYLWQDGTTTSVYSVSGPGVYRVQLSLNNCIVCDSIIVTAIDCNAEIEIPNIITPNNDKINDIFIPIKISNIQKMNTRIYNRWGNLIYETENLNIEWNGKYNSKYVADGVYYWVISYVAVNNKEGILKGSLTILK